MGLVLVTTGDANTILDKVDEWFVERHGVTDRMTPSEMFADVRSTAVMAVAEYLANKRGLTFYEERAES